MEGREHVRDEGAASRLRGGNEQDGRLAGRSAERFLHKAAGGRSVTTFVLAISLSISAISEGLRLVKDDDEGRAVGM